MTSYYKIHFAVKNRSEFLNHTRNHSYGFWRAVHMEPFYREKYGYRQGQFPKSENAGESVIFIPLYEHFSDDMARDVIAEVKFAVNNIQ